MGLILNGNAPSKILYNGAEVSLYFNGSKIWPDITPVLDEVTIGTQTCMSKNLAIDDGQGGISTRTVNYGQGDVVEYYNTRLVKQSIQEDTLKNAYKTALENYNKKNKEEKLDYLELMMADSYNWSVGTNMKIHTMSEPFDKDSDGLYRYKYKGKNITGEQLVIYSTCFGGSDEFIYVINGNKATKITSKELDIPNDEDGNFCF